MITLFKSIGEVIYQECPDSRQPILCPYKTTEPKTIGFFKPAVIDWYDDIFLDEYYITKSQVNDAKEYKEFKKLVKELRFGRFKNL
jgi:hypothetical protein